MKEVQRFTIRFPLCSGLRFAEKCRRAFGSSLRADRCVVHFHYPDRGSTQRNENRGGAEYRNG